jgi:hypothetical protein
MGVHREDKFSYSIRLAPYYGQSICGRVPQFDPPFGVADGRQASTIRNDTVDLRIVGDVSPLSSPEVPLIENAVSATGKCDVRAGQTEQAANFIGMTSEDFQAASSADIPEPKGPITTGADHVATLTERNAHHLVLVASEHLQADIPIAARHARDHFVGLP